MAIHTATTDAELTAAITAAVYGDEIQCQAGTTFTNTSGVGSYVFPIKSGYSTGATILVTTTATSGLPAAGHRTNPSYAALMPSFQSRQATQFQNEPALQIEPGAKGWVFRHLRILPTYLGVGTSVRIGRQSSSLQYKKSQQPEAIVFDRCYFAVPNQYVGAVRGIQRHGKNLTVTECYFDPHGTPTTQTQCIWDLNGEGPYIITNNFLGGATEPYLTGGADAEIRTVAVVGSSPAPTTTSMFVTWLNSTHPDSDPPVVGQHIAIQTANAARRHAYVIAYTPSTSSSGQITFSRVEGSPGVPLQEVPLVGGDVRWGAIPTGITFQHNLVQQPAEWLNPIIPAPSNVNLSVSSGGTLLAGTYGFRVASRKALNAGTIRNSTAIGNADGTNKTIVVAANQRVTATWTAAPDSEGYRAYLTFPDLLIRFIDVPAGTTTVTWTNPSDGASTGSVASAATWDINNLFELKFGINVDVSQNIFRQCPTGLGSSGYAIWLKVVNQASSYGAEWYITKNVDIHHNVIYDTHGVLSTSAREFESGNQIDRPGQMTIVKFRHNLCYNTAGTIWSRGATDNWGITLTGGDAYLFDHNTIDHTTKAATRLLAEVSRDNYITNPVWTNNLFVRNIEGFKGQNTSTTSLGNVEGTTSLNNYSLGTYTFTNNAIAGAPAASYPAGNLFPTVAGYQAYFTDYAGKDFTLAPGSAAIGAGTGGSDLGADVATVLAGVETVITGIPLEGPPPVVTTTSPLPQARVNQFYSHTLTAVDGDPPYTWDVVPGLGTLPAGIVLSATTGILSGIPTTAGDATFTIRVTDDNATTGTKVLVLPVGVPLGPTRYYFPSTGIPDLVPATRSSGWTTSSLAANEILPLTTTKLGTSRVLARKVATAANPGFTVLRQYIGPSLARQVIGGTFKMQAQCGENSTNLNATLAAVIRIVNSAGEEVAVLSNGGSPVPVASEDVSTTPPEFPAITLGATPAQEKNRRLRDSAGLVAIPLQEYECADGDRLVVEIGYRDASTSTSASGAFIVGDNGSSDLPEGDS